jgi:beta-glucanase (GH16 family)
VIKHVRVRHVAASTSTPARPPSTARRRGRTWPSILAVAAMATVLVPSGGVAPAEAASPPSGVSMPGDSSSWRRVFSDDFTGTSLNGSKWSKYAGRPGSDPGAQWAKSHVTVGGGVVNLLTYKDSAYGGRWTSGGINNGRANVPLSSGRYEVRMRTERAKGINLAALLWPSRGGWPPEVDFAEDRDGDRRDFTTTVHYKNRSKSHGMIHGKKALDMTKWHTYGVQWSPGKIVYTVDGRVWKTISSSNVPRVGMELAIQTNAVTRGRVKPDWRTPKRSKVQIDWVAAYRRR